MKLIERRSALWTYLSNDIRGLISDGELLVGQVQDISNKVSDYSFLVFPFSKAYEGFLKKMFLDLILIREDEYYGDDIRIGRILNPGFVHEHANVFKKLATSTAEDLWKIWKRGRNQVFHYFPHNFRKLNYEEAVEIIEDLIVAMSRAVKVGNLL